MKSYALGIGDNILHGCTNQRVIYPDINPHDGILVMNICKYEKNLG